MARHRLEDNENEETWGGPELAENQDHQPQRHRRERDKNQSLGSDDERGQPPPH